MRTEMLYIIAGMAVVTYLTRISFLILVGRIVLPGFLSRGLKFIPIGILTAFVIPGLMITGGQVNLTLGNYYLLAGLVSGLVAARWKNVFLAMGSGMLMMVILKSTF
ncbi:hypothetical protein SY88_01445 [Clostridiales bacterium PH28_bin88]|nr:hypothetical protein SY88_01445 [Clostridiales bacterium PH28_bin88]